MSDTQFSVVASANQTANPGDSPVPVPNETPKPIAASGDAGDIDDFDQIPTDDRKLERVPIPEWGGKAVYVRPLSASDAIRFSMMMADPAKKFEGQAKLLQFALVKRSGEPLVPNNRYEEFKDRNVKVFNYLSEKILVDNGFKDPKKTETALKND